MIIQIKELNKSFGKFPALKNINADVSEGEIFGILGLNAAGKTTLMRCLVNYYYPDSGQILFKNRPVRESDIYTSFGYLPEDFQPPVHLCALELVRFLSRTLDSKISVETCLEWVGLLQDGRKRISAYSRGMIQRLGLALALVKDPQVLVLDEPILGLDVVGQRQVFGLLKELNRKGKTIILSTHIFPHIENFCHRVGIIDKGMLRFSGTIDALCFRHGGVSLEDAFLMETVCSSG